MPSNIVILIDLNSFPCYKTLKSEPAEVTDPVNPDDPSNGSTRTFETSSSLFDRTTEEFPDSNEIETLDQFLLRNAKWVQEYILTLLSKEATHNNEVDFTDYFWSYSFYNSAKDLPSKYGKRFHGLDLTSFEAFEKHLVEELKNTYSQNKTCPGVNKMSCLSSVIKNMIGGDLPWTEPTVVSDESATVLRKSSRNALYAMLRVPRSENECLNFVDDVSVLARSQNFINTLLPRAFFKEFHNRFRIQLNFVDMWYAHGARKSAAGDSWDGTYAAPIGKVLHYLNGGKVLPLTKIEFVPPGLPSYVSLLKLTLKANTSPKASDGKRLSGLLQPNNLKGLKISPETEDSFANSMISDTARSSAQYKSQECPPSNGTRSGSFKQLIKKEPIDMDGYSHIKSPRKKRLKRKRKQIKSEIKRAVGDSNQEESSEEEYVAHYDEQAKQKAVSKGKPCERLGNSRHSQLNQSQEELINSSARWTRPNGKKQPLPASTKASTSKLPLTVGHTYLAKVKQGNGNSKTDYVERVLKSGGKRSQSAAEKQKTAMRETSLKNIKLQLTAFLKNVTLDPDAPEAEVVKTLSLKIGVFKDMITINDNISDIELVSLAQGLVNVLTCTLRKFESVKNMKEAMESVLLDSYESLNVKIMEHKYNSSTSCYAFHKCQLQILLKFELSWMWPGNEKETREIRDDVLKLLNLISAYRKEPHIEDFIVNTLMEAYAEVQSTLLAAIFRGMAIPLPKKMRMMMSPAANDKNFPDDVSQASSMDSSLSQLDSISVAKSHTQSYSQNRQSIRAKPLLRNSSYLSLGNPKKPIMVPGPKLSRSHKLKSDSAKKKLALAVSRSSPKRVRRNLFDVKKHDKEDLKTLMALATTSRFSRSPSLKFRSPSSFKSRSPRSPAYLRGSRSKRRLQMEDDVDGTPIGVKSPDMFSNSGILCPESPSTPNSAYYKRSRMTSFESSEKNVIQESPEVAKTKCGNRPLMRVDSLSFYSAKNSSDKAISWEKSGAKMMAARIKDSVDLTQSLLINDLEFLNGSPDVQGELITNKSPEDGDLCPNSSEHEVSQNELPVLGLMESPYESNCNMGLNSEEPCSSKSVISTPFQFEVSPNNISPNIEALIRSENFPPSSLILNSRRSNKSVACTSILETPTKKVQFNFNESLISTPSPARNMSTTPKSILK